MNIFFILIVAFLSPQCGKKADFSCVKAESQNFAGGTVWSTSGTNYFIHLKANRNLRNVKVVSVYVGKTKFDNIQASIDGIASDFADIDKGDLVVLTFSKLINNRPEVHMPDELIPVQEELPSHQENIETPYDYSGEALICYLERGKKKYMEIEIIEKLKPLLRP